MDTALQKICQSGEHGEWENTGHKNKERFEVKGLIFTAKYVSQCYKNVWNVKHWMYFTNPCEPVPSNLASWWTVKYV